MNDYYVYEWIRLDTNEPFYVGKGHNNRWKCLKRNSRFNNIVKSIPVAVNILHDNLDEKTAYGLEVWYIREYRDIIGYEMCNFNDGGEGCSLIGEANPRWEKGYLIKGENHPMYRKHQTEEAIIKITQAKLGENNPMFGKHHNEEIKNKISKSMPNRKPIFCIELNILFNSIAECVKYMKNTYNIKFNADTLKKYLKGEYKKDYYKEVEINGELIKLHWEYR